MVAVMRVRMLVIGRLIAIFIGSGHRMAVHDFWRSAAMRAGR